MLIRVLLRELIGILVRMLHLRQRGKWRAPQD